MGEGSGVGSSVTDDEKTDLPRSRVRKRVEINWKNFGRELNRNGEELEKGLENGSGKY